MPLQVMLSGLAIGSIYALIALGMVMLVKALDLVNIAQGELVMAGAFVGLAAVQAAHLPFPLALLAAIVAAAVLGVALEQMGIRPLKRPTVVTMITATIALSIVLKNAGMLLGGVKPLVFPAPFREAPVVLFGAAIVPQTVAVIAIALALVAALSLFFRTTRLGIAMRAVMDDREMAMVMGIPFRRTVSLAFALSGALGGAAGVLVAPLIFVSFDMGTIALKAFAGAVLGGLYSLPGAVVGGVLLGLLETLTAAYISSGYKDAVALGVLIVVLLVRPEGLWGGR